MTTPNKHIEDFLEYYYQFPSPPEYAVLLKGAWGSGKTWFINKFLKKLAENGNDHIYVSLYGVTNTKDIEREIISSFISIKASNNILDNKYVKKSMETLNKAFGDKIPEVNIASYLPSDTLIIFDDLERCSMRINDLLGYINGFVEHKGLKVIIIANETKILEKQNNEESKNSYKDIKEKLIGESFEIKADLEGALDYFISNIKTEAVNSFYTEQKQLISRLYLESSYNNLRHLKQALWGFERFYEVLRNKVMESNGLLIDLLKVYLMYSFEIKSGNILADKLKPKLFTKDDDKRCPFKRIEEKYTNLPGFSAHRILEMETWEDIFDKGLLNDKEINRRLLASNYFYDENTPDWKKLWSYWEITDDEFDKCIENVEKFFEERKYEEIGEIKHIVAELLSFSEMKIYSEPTDKILRSAKEYVSWLSSNDKLPDIRVTESPLWNKSYESFEFLNRDSDDFKKLCRFIDDQIGEATLKKLPEIGKNLLELMEKDVKTFVSQFIPLDGSCIYYDRPILTSIDSEKFVDTFISLSPPDQDMVRSIFQKRYNYNINCDNELDWLVEIDKFMAQRQKQLKGKLSGYRLGKYSISLEKAIMIIKTRNKETN